MILGLAGADHWTDSAVGLIDSLVDAGFAAAVGSSGPPENVDLVHSRRLKTAERRFAES